MFRQMFENRWHRLDRNDFTFGPDAMRGEQREITDVCTDIDETVAMLQSACNPCAKVWLPQAEVIQGSLNPIASVTADAPALRCNGFVRKFSASQQAPQQ